MPCTRCGANGHSLSDCPWPARIDRVANEKNQGHPDPAAMAEGEMHYLRTLGRANRPRADDTRWGLCLESPPTIVATVDEDDGSPTVECVLPWTEMPFGCGRHMPHKSLMQ